MIATSAGGMAEAIVDGQTGLIVPPADSTALSEAILRYFRAGLAEPFARNIRENKESSSWMPLVYLIEELYAEIALVYGGQATVEIASPRVL
jgi:glycosyltransferase involved in cell wall biosynthesis